MKKYASLMIIFSGCLWGTSGLFVRSLNDMGLHAMEVVEVRCLLAALIMLPILFFRDKSQLKLRLRNVPFLLSSGIFSIVFFNYCYFSAMAVMDLSVAAILLYTAPIFVMLLSLVLFRERLSVRKIIALILAFGGCCLVCGLGAERTALTWQGILLGLGAGFGYALYSIFSRYSFRQGLGSMTVTFYTFLFAAVGGAFIADFSSVGAAFQIYGAKLFVWAIVYTVVTTVLPYLLYTTGLQYVENGAASVMASVEPVVATLMGFLVFSETPTVTALLGIGLVLIALAVLNIEKKK